MVSFRFVVCEMHPMWVVQIETPKGDYLWNEFGHRIFRHECQYAIVLEFGMCSVAALSGRQVWVSLHATLVYK